MDNTMVRDLVSHLRHSPDDARVASVYYDATHDTEDASKILELTWREIREDLTERGADSATLNALDEAIQGGRVPEGRGGRALVAAGGEVLLDAELTEPPPRTIARWSALPYLVPLVAHGTPAVSHVVARMDKIGADITSVNRHGHTVDQHTVLGADHPVHETGSIAGLPRRHDREHVQETVKQNITKVAEDVTAVARGLGADLIVISGEVKGRRALAGALPEQLQRRTVDVGAGGREQEWHDDAAESEVRTLVAEAQDQRIAQTLQRFRAESGRGDDGLAIQGVPAICAALREANVEFLLIGAPGDATVISGADPIEVASAAQDLRSLGISAVGERRADEALPYAAIAVGADLIYTGDDVALVDGFGALLRYR